MAQHLSHLLFSLVLLSVCVSVWLVQSDVRRNKAAPSKLIKGEGSNLERSKVASPKPKGWFKSGWHWTKSSMQYAFSLMMLYYAGVETITAVKSFVTYLRGTVTGAKSDGQQSPHEVYDMLQQASKRLNAEMSLVEEQIALEAAGLGTTTEKIHPLRRLLEDQWFLLVAIAVMINLAICLYFALRHYSTGEESLEPIGHGERKRKRSKHRTKWKRRNFTE